MGEKIPVNLITGFLGAGKTTLLNRLLQGGFGGERVAVVVNDFGSVAVDAALLERQDEGVVALPNGCICCTLAGSLVKGLQGLLEAGYERIVLETSGLTRVADLRRVMELPELAARSSVASVIAVVDTTRYLEMHEVITTVDEQLRSSDVIILNRRDLVSDEHLHEVERAVRALNGAARLLTASYCDVPFEHLRQAGAAAPAAATGAPADDWRSFNLRFPQPVEPKRLATALARLPGEVYRLKGFVRGPEGCLHVEWAGGQSRVDEWNARVPEEARDLLVVIGAEALSREQLAAAFADVAGLRVEAAGARSEHPEA